MKLCFIGGGNPLTGELDDVINYLSNDISKEHKILIIPFAADVSKYNKWLHSAEKFFASFGVKHIKLLDSRLSNNEMRKEIHMHNLLYFTGGRPEKLIETIIEKDLHSTIKDFSGLMIGISAGALAFCKECIITKDDDYPETQIIKGLGLVDFSVEVHYDGTADDELIPLSAGRDIYAIPDGNALFWDGQAITAIHTAFHFKNKNLGRVL